MGGFALLLLLLSGAAKEVPRPTDSGRQQEHIIHVVSIGGPCSQVLNDVVLTSATRLAFSFPEENLLQGFVPIVTLTLRDLNSRETYSIPIALAQWDPMNSSLSNVVRVVFVAQDPTPPGEFNALLRVDWGKGAPCRESEVRFRLATITGNPADIATIKIPEDPSAGGSLRSGGSAAAEGGARLGCALQAQASTAAPSGVWFFLCAVSLGILLISLRVRSSPAGTLGS